LIVAQLLSGSVLALGVAAAATPSAPVHVRFGERQLPGAERCVAPAALRGAVEVLLGYDPFDDRAPRAIDVEVRPRPSGFEAEVTLRDEAGAALGGRKLVSGSQECAELTDALALAIGNAIDPVRASQAPTPGPPPEPARAAAALPPPAPSPPAAARPSFLGSLGVLGAAGAAPGVVNAGAQLELELRWPRYSLSLGGRADFPASMSYDSGSIGGELLVGELAPCLRLARFGACLLGALGTETAQSASLPGSTQQSALYAAAGARALFDIVEPRALGLRAALDILAPVTREDFLVGTAVAFATPPVAVALSLSGVVEVF